MVKRPTFGSDITNPKLTSPLHAVTSLRPEAVAGWTQAGSWRDAGVVPVVLSELPPSLGRVNGVQTVTWKKPLAWHGRKLATVAECLQISDSLNAERGALILNADLYLGPGFPAVLDEVIASEGLVLFTRWEIERWPMLISQLQSLGMKKVCLWQPPSSNPL